MKLVRITRRLIASGLMYAAYYVDDTVYEAFVDEVVKRAVPEMRDLAKDFSNSLISAINKAKQQKQDA